MNILFALHNDFNSNSANHVHNFANHLVTLGHDCVVAVPGNPESLANLDKVAYRGISFHAALAGNLPFSNGRGPDILHAWTPREAVRHFSELMVERYDSDLFVHLEDNEWHLLAIWCGIPETQLRFLAEDEIERWMEVHLFHPVKGQAFMSSAKGVTVIIDRLKEFVPPGVPILELWPAAEEAFKKMPRPSPRSRAALGIPANSSVVVYTGNVHSANAREMRSLYLAIAILNREGFPITLVRTGKDYFPFLGPGEEWGRRNAIELGIVLRSELPGILAFADIFVQPGRADSFNDYRFPSKLPEFLSIGRPVIVPGSNIAHRMTHGEHAFILPNANGPAIAAAIKEVLGDAQLRERLSRGALEFSKNNLNWHLSAKKLLGFYLEQRAQPSPIFAQTCARSEPMAFRISCGAL